MKALKLIALFAGLSLMFMGCPYEAAVPIDVQDLAKVDKSLVGVWEAKGDEDYQYKVTLDGNLYRIEKKNIKDGGEPTIYKGWLSDVNGVLFFNIYEVNDYSSSSDRKYYLYRVEKKSDGGRVKLRAVTDNITESFTTSAELKAFIKKNMELSFFYNKDDEKMFYKNDDAASEK